MVVMMKLKNIETTVVPIPTNNRKSTFSKKVDIKFNGDTEPRTKLYMDSEKTEKYKENLKSSPNIGKVSVH